MSGQAEQLFAFQTSESSLAVRFKFSPHVTRSPLRLQVLKHGDSCFESRPLLVWVVNATSSGERAAVVLRSDGIPFISEDFIAL